MSLLATVKTSLVTNDAFATILSMTKWCAGYACYHQGIYLASLWMFPRGEEKYAKLDVPNSKYWNSTLRRISTARVVAMTHAIASWAWSVRVLSGAWTSLRVYAKASFLSYDLPNDAAGLAFMRHSLGYFIQELAHVLIFEPDLIFIAHHILYLLATFPLCAASNSGWPLIAIATCLAEATNPLQLCWEMGKAFNNDRLYHLLSTPFTAAFTLCRGILMPLAFIDIIRCVRQHPKPMLTWTCSLMCAGILAGLAWLAQLIKGFRKYRKNRHQDKLD